MIVEFNNRTQSSILNEIEATQTDMFYSWDDDYLREGTVALITDADFSDEEVRRKYYYVLCDLYSIAVDVINCARFHMRRKSRRLRSSPVALAEWIEEEFDGPWETPSEEAVRILALDLATRLLEGLREEALHEKKIRLAQY